MSEQDSSLHQLLLELQKEHQTYLLQLQMHDAMIKRVEKFLTKTDATLDSTVLQPIQLDLHQVTKERKDVSIEITLQDVRDWTLSTIEKNGSVYLRQIAKAFPMFNTKKISAMLSKNTSLFSYNNKTKRWGLKLQEVQQ